MELLSKVFYLSVNKVKIVLKVDFNKRYELMHYISALSD